MPSQKDAKLRPVATALIGNKRYSGIGPLRVVVFEEDGAWFAQAIEIDYLAQGSSKEDAKQRFQEGLELTVERSISANNGDVSPLLRQLKPAPEEVWRECVFLPGAELDRYSQITVHDMPHTLQGALPFDEIRYMERKAA